MLAFFIRILPKVGPLRALSFRTPTPETEKLFMESFNATIERYKALLVAERSRRTQPADVNLDVGRSTTAGMYTIADKTYAKLLDELSMRRFAGIPPELRADILNFYKSEATTSRADDKHALKLRQQLELLRVATASSRQ